MNAAGVSHCVYVSKSEQERNKIAGIKGKVPEPCCRNLTLSTNNVTNRAKSYFHTGGSCLITGIVSVRREIKVTLCQENREITTDRRAGNYEPVLSSTLFSNFDTKAKNKLMISPFIKMRYNERKAYQNLCLNYYIMCIHSLRLNPIT